MPEKTILNNGKEVTYTYDTLGRLTGKVLNTTTPLNYAYSYEASDRGSGYTTTKVETEQIGDTTYKYTYDVYGNITCIYKVNSDNTETLLCSYVYDSYNQLTTVNDYEHSEQTTYTYNQAGNIIRRNRYQMNSSWVTTATLENVHYVYGDSEWKDLLTTYNGQTITYDAIGNPLSYRDGISLTWQKGRKLASYSDSNNNITYTYDASGMRTGKAVTNSSGATTNYSYVYENGLLQKMTRGSRILEFSYDASGNPVSFSYRSSIAATPTYYYYALNSRGDVIGLYNANGALSSTYEYDAYGKLLSVKTPAGIEITGETSVAILNPLRYRGYVYDTETGFYYLQSRYYDPTICRFINADGYVSTGQGIMGYNMYIYCGNNPQTYVDNTGQRQMIASSTSTETYDERKASCSQMNAESIKKAYVAGGTSVVGPPGKSVVTAWNKDGTVKQRRWYDENGNAIRDRDYNHGGDMEFPHDHEWGKDGRSNEHFPPDPNYPDSDEEDIAWDSQQNNWNATFSFPSFDINTDDIRNSVYTIGTEITVIGIFAILAFGVLAFA